jgi:hypothetical protein
MFLQYVAIYVQIYTVLPPRRSSLTSSLPREPQIPKSQWLLPAISLL